MKAKTFENLIRKIVREEIDYALRREIKTLKEDLRDDLKPLIKEEIIETPKSIKSPLKEKITGNSSINPPPSKNLEFTQNSSLNDLLNETARGDTNLEGGMMTPDPTIPDPVENVVNRDYSDLMKAISNKKGR
tara:strand:- start:136 stop:534 length:399 start_codon:yes stop_codon:yes gene_type:complete